MIETQEFRRIEEEISLCGAANGILPSFLLLLLLPLFPLL